MKRRTDERHRCSISAFRDAKLANWWFIGHGWHAVQQHDDSLRLTENGLDGVLELRCYDARGRQQDVAKLTFQVSRSDETLQGEVGLQLTGHEMQAWKSTVRGSFLKPAESFDPKAQWPNFAGPMGTLQVSPGGPALVDDLAQSRPLWRSESQVPVSYGNAADDRYATRAAGCRSGGGVEFAGLCGRRGLRRLLRTSTVPSTRTGARPTRAGASSTAAKGSRSSLRK